MNEIAVDLSKWRMREHAQWTKLLKEAEVDEQNALMATCVTKWPFEGSPSDPEAYADLSPLEWREVLEAVGNATVRAFQRPGERLDKSN